MTAFSANLGFLWTDLSLPEAIRAAKAAGFQAVECHWPFDTPSGDVNAALSETGLAMLGLNTRRGNVEAGDFGICAVPGREDEARAVITEAIDYAKAIGAGAVHVMAGKCEGPEAHATFVAALRFAAEQAGEGITILLEPINRHDAPGYFLKTTDQAVAIINEIGAPNIKLMFDCYHTGRTEGDVITRFETLKPYIGHVQIAAVPDRGAPDHGELYYPAVLAAVDASGWTVPVGAEYKPAGPTGESLSWMDAYR